MMSFEVFKQRINALIASCDESIEVWFSMDEDKGKYFANCSDGTVIVGHPRSLRVTVKWGSGHTAMAAI